MRAKYTGIYTTLLLMNDCISRHIRHSSNRHLNLRLFKENGPEMVSNNVTRSILWLSGDLFRHKSGGNSAPLNQRGVLQGSATNTLLKSDTGPKLMQNGTRPGPLTIRLIDTVTGEGANGDQRSAVYVMLARGTRRPMTDLRGGGSKPGSLRSYSASNHRITLRLLSAFSSI